LGILNDDIWRTIIHLRDKKCQYCKTRNVEDAHHIITKGAGNFQSRFSIENGIGLCRECHSLAHNDKDKEFRQFLIKDWFFSEKKYDDIYIVSQMIFKPKEGDFKLIAMDLMQQLNNLTSQEFPENESMAERKRYLKGLRK